MTAPLAGVYERFTHSPLYALRMFDGLAGTLVSRVPDPPLLSEPELRVIETIGPPRARVDPPLELWTMRNRTGYVLFDGTWFRDGAGGRRFPLAAGQYTVEIRASGYQVQTFVLDWKDPTHGPGPAVRLPFDIRMLPGPTYPFPATGGQAFSLGFTLLRGTVLSAMGDPIAGAKVSVTGLVFNPAWPFVDCLTSESGDWAILLPDRRTFNALAEESPAPIALVIAIAVQLQPPNGPVVVANENVVLGTEHIIGSTSLRGRVHRQRGGPIAGAVITTSVNARTTTSNADGRWSLYFAPDQPGTAGVTVTATLPDGTAKPTGGLALVHGKTVLVPTFEFP
jgi:hypothetical protein